MTTKKHPPMTAAEHSRLLEANPEFVALRKAREQERAERSARLRVEEEPILADLREIGLDCKSVWDLVNTATKYPEAVPILLKHLLLPYSDRTREGIARSLAVPEARDAWPILVSEYCKAPMGTGIKVPGDTKEFKLGAKDGLACALSATATDATLEELIGLVKDQTHGESRLLLLSALRKSKNPMAKQTLEELANDPDFKKEIGSWRKRR